jgi:hypothetical protein
MALRLVTVVIVRGTGKARAATAFELGHGWNDMQEWSTEHQLALRRFLDRCCT